MHKLACTVISTLKAQVARLQKMLLLMIVFYAGRKEDGSNIYDIQDEEIEIRVYNEEERNRRNGHMNR